MSLDCSEWNEFGFGMESGDETQQFWMVDFGAAKWYYLVLSHSAKRTRASLLQELESWISSMEYWLLMFCALQVRDLISKKVYMCLNK